LPEYLYLFSSNADDPLPAKLVVGVLTLFQFLFFALLLGAIESSLSQKLCELKGGRTKVSGLLDLRHISSVHALLLGELSVE
jgi:hypothetical protein